jgi:2-methylaconitate cis-trans-isomerase PrpF
VNEAEAERVLDRLLAWGLVEDRAGEILPTRRWSARLQAAAEKLNVLAAQTGVNPEGNPLVLAVSQALAAENLTEDEREFRAAAQALVTLELSRMTPAKRAQMGFGDVAL